MNTEEVAEFEKNPNLEAIVKVRLFDDQGKIPGRKTEPFSYYESTIQKIVDSHQA